MTTPASPQMPGGQVTLADLFRVLSAIQSDMSKMATRLEVIDTRNKSADEIHRDHEARLRILETAKAKIYGAAITISAVTSALGSWLAYLAGHH